MPQINISLLTLRSKMEIPFIYLSTFENGGDLAYLQSIRTGTLKKRSPTGNPEDHPVARGYHAMINFTVSRLVSQIEGEFDAVVSPPSRFPLHAEPYRRGAIEKLGSAIDLTGRFHRTTAVSSGEDATLEELYSSLSYSPGGDESRITSLLIVDDVCSRGTTAGALVSKLQDAGLPETSRVTLASPLWLKR